jgi:hypothetical protein
MAGYYQNFLIWYRRKDITRGGDTMSKEGLQPVSLVGREFTVKELELIKEIVGLYPCLSRLELSKTICENISWQAPNGRNKHDSCLKALEKLESRGHIKLPSLRPPRAQGRRKVEITRHSDPGEYIQGRIDQWDSIRIRKVKREQLRLWNEYVQRYHYLGYRSAFGLHQRYFIVSGNDRLLGCILYTAAAWALECRDKWIGWTYKQKERNLYRIINNSRFLIFPWVRLKNLSSHVLSLANKEVEKDWQERFGYKPVLVETFVDPERFKGTIYRASNWTHIGKTKGRGRQDRYSKNLSTVKDVYVYILDANFREELAL